MHVPICSPWVQNHWVGPTARLEHHPGDALDWAGGLSTQEMVEAGCHDFGRFKFVLTTAEGFSLA